MRKIMFMLLLIMVLNCSKQGLVNDDITNNPEINVTVLFDYDGVRVYRFEDAGKYRYFCKDISGHVMTMNKIKVSKTVGQTTIVSYHENNIQTIKDYK